MNVLIHYCKSITNLKRTTGYGGSPNVYEEEEEAMHEDAKIRFLYNKVQHPDLQPAIQALKVQESMGTVISYAAAANHISTAVTELPEYISKHRNISGLNSHGNSEGNS